MPDIIYPISFEDYHICIHCGSHEVEAIDKFDCPTKEFIYPLKKFRCAKCGTEYYIKWVKNKEGKIIPVCCGDTDIKDVANDIINFSKSQRRKIK